MVTHSHAERPLDSAQCAQQEAQAPAPECFPPGLVPVRPAPQPVSGCTCHIKTRWPRDETPPQRPLTIQMLGPPVEDSSR